MRPSRDIAHVIRIAAVCTARQHTVIAIAEQIRKASPRPSPSVLFSRYGMPDVLSSLALRSPTAIMPTSIISPPTMNAAVIARRIARGACRRGCVVSSASEPAVSKP